jgi:ribokinase
VRVAVVGHVEWTRLARVERVPAPGEIAHASVDWEGPAGGGAVAAVQVARLAGGCTFFTALGDDDLGQRAQRVLRALGVELRAVVRAAATRDAVALIDDSGERTLTTLGERLAPTTADPLGWGDLANFDGVYFTAGDAGALGAARQARILVASLRELRVCAASGLRIDAMVGSARDEAERYEVDVLAEHPGLVVLTDGAAGGSYSVGGGSAQPYPATEPPGCIVDTYGTGDNFAAALTVGLAGGASPAAAVAVAARSAAAALCCRGPFSRAGC